MSQTRAMLRRAPRRTFLKLALTGFVGAALPGRGVEEAAAEKRSWAQPFDEEMRTFMSERRVPGGALAVVRQGRLVYTQGYGWADRERAIRAHPASLFRIASLSKPITAVAVLKLCQQRRIDLDSAIGARLEIPPLVPANRKRDARLDQITIRHLLHHTGGWDSAKSGDPMFRLRAIAEALDVECPPTQRDLIRFVLGQRLDFDPGTRYAYSNFGYCLLGRLIEKLSGQTYEQFVRQTVLEPIGVRSMRLGFSLETKRTEGEARYYAGGEAESVFSKPGSKVPRPYGGFCLEAMDAHGGWIASVIDLARFAAALDSDAPNPLLSPAERQTLHEPPAPPVSRKADGSLEASWYGCGWMIRPVGQSRKVNAWHNGSLPGTFALLVRRWDDLSWVALFNRRSEDPQHPDGAIDRALHRAADRVKHWPATNLFER